MIGQRGSNGMTPKIQEGFWDFLAACSCISIYEERLDLLDAHEKSDVMCGVFMRTKSVSIVDYIPILC